MIHQKFKKISSDKKKIYDGCPIKVQAKITVIFKENISYIPQKLHTFVIS